MLGLPFRIRVKRPIFRTPASEKSARNPSLHKFANVQAEVCLPRKLTFMIQGLHVCSTFKYRYIEYVCIYMFIHIHTCIHTYIPTYIHTLMYIQTDRLTHSHTYPTRPYPTLPYPTLPYPTVPCRTLPYPTVPYRTVPYRTDRTLHMYTPHIRYWLCTYMCMYVCTYIIKKYIYIYIHFIVHTPVATPVCACMQADRQAGRIDR